MRQNHKPCDSRNAVLLCLTFVSHKAQQWLFSRQRIMCLQWLDIHVSTSNPVPPFMIQRCSRLHILQTHPHPTNSAPATDRLQSTWHGWIREGVDLRRPWAGRQWQKCDDLIHSQAAPAKHVDPLRLFRFHGAYCARLHRVMLIQADGKLQDRRGSCM